MIPEQVTTKITVKSRTEVQERDGRTGYKLECDIPLLYGPKKLPVLVWGCPEQDAPKAGETLTATLTRGKQSDSYDGTAYWHYAWRWGSRAADAAPETGRAPAIGPARASEGRDASIEQQVASKNRTELAIACLQQAVVYAVAEYERLPLGAQTSWDIVVKAAQDAYDKLRAVAEVVRWQQPAPEGEAPDDTEADVGF